MSKIFNFTAAPIPGSNVPIKFVAYGDMGVTPSPGSIVTARESLKEVKNGAQLVLHIGDISYARGYVSEILAFNIFIHSAYTIFKFIITIVIIIIIVMMTLL